METTRGLTVRLGEELRLKRGESLRRQVLCNLVKSADILAELTLSAWAWVSETLEREGFEGQELTEYCQILLGGIDATLKSHQLLRAKAQSLGISNEIAGLHGLEAKLPSLENIRPKIAEVLGLASPPHRSVDESKLAESTAAIEKGQFVSLDNDYLDRLKATGAF
jgi:hypothetical protein